jgi:tetratricopeptide (TPR) repeat protein
MTPNSLNLNRRLPPLTQTEIYQSLVNSLDDRSGFGILFIQCAPADADRLIPRLQGDLPEKTMAVLNLDAPINNLYHIVKQRPDLEQLNVLFIRGLEKSLEADIKPGYGGLGDYYNLNTVPPILNHLNQQREGFRDEFPHLCFVFVLPPFGIRYFVRRAPDFYDWNSGVFEVCSENEISHPNVYSGNALEFSTEGSDSPYRKGMLALLRGNWEEAIAFYDKAIENKPDKHGAWHGRGFALIELGRYEEAIKSYDKVMEIKPDKHGAWHGRGCALEKLGRYEEAIASYDKAIRTKSGGDRDWNNRELTYFKWGKYSEFLECLNQSINIKLDKYDSWHNKGVAQFVIGDYTTALESWRTAYQYINDPAVPRYYEDIAGLIGEAIEQLIPRCAAPDLANFIPAVIDLYPKYHLLNELSVALTQSLIHLLDTALSNEIADRWLQHWQNHPVAQEPALEMPLRLMATTLNYKKDPSQRQRLWLQLPREERSILDQALKIDRS